MGTQVVDMNDPNGMPKKVLIFVMGVVIFLSISQMVGAFEMSLPKATIHKHMKKLGIPNSLCKHEDLQEAKKASMVGQKSRPLRLISLSDMGRMASEPIAYRFQAICVRRPRRGSAGCGGQLPLWGHARLPSNYKAMFAMLN